MIDDNLQGNISTISVFIWTILSPYIANYVSQDIFVAILGLLLVLWSAYNPNTFEIFGNAIKRKDTPVTDVLNDEYVTGDDIGE